MDPAVVTGAAAGAVVIAIFSVGVLCGIALVIVRREGG